MDNGLEILYENEMYVVLIKPVGVLSESTGSKSVASLLGVDELYTVHRLDKDVSGVMVYAKTKFAAAKLSRDIAEHRFKKEYLAVVHSVPEDSGEMVDLSSYNSIYDAHIRKALKSVKYDICLKN